MSQIKITTESFNLSSRWRCATNASGAYYVAEGPSTASLTRIFAFSLPAGAIVNYVRVYATLGNPLTGAAVKTANSVKIEDGYAEQELNSFDASSGSFAVTFRFKAYGAVYSDTNYHSGSMSFDDVYLLIDYTIPNSTWSISAPEVAAGDTVTITIEPFDMSCTHELLLSFGSLSETYVIEAGVLTYELLVLREWLKEIPNTTSGVAMLKLKTMQGGVELGLSDAVGLTIVCPDDVAPSIGSLTTEVINPVWGLCVQNYSSVQVVATNCAGAYGSEVRAGFVTANPLIGNSWSVVDSGAVVCRFEGALNVSGEVVLTVTITDSRGRSSTATTTIEVQPYAGPSITQTVQGRANSDGVSDPQGKYVYAGAVYSYTALGTNRAIVQISYREDGTSDWITGYEGTLTSGETVCFGGEFSTALVYEIRIVVTDDLAATTVVRTIGTAYAFMKWMPQNSAIGFGCIPRSSNMFEVGSDWRVYAYGKDIESYAPMRNYVDNGYFLHPINQRGFDREVWPNGLTFMYLDRWEVVGIGASVSINMEEDVGVHMNGISSDEYIELRQRFEGYPNMAGDAYTIVVCADGLTYDYAFVMGECADGHEIGDVIFYSSENAHIAFRCHTTVTIQWIAMYKGALNSEALPKYIPKGYGVEFAECSRYFARVGAKTINWLAQQVYIGFYLNATTVIVTVPFSNVLRDAPQATYGAWDVDNTMENTLKLYNADGTEATITDVSYVPNQNGGVRVQISVDEATSGEIHTAAILHIVMAIHLSADI